MDTKLCAVGFCCADVYEKLGLFYPTGNGIDWGIHLARMGVPVSAVSVVGSDAYGSRMREALEKEHIDISHLRVAPGQTCKMLMDLRNGTDRVHLEEIEGVMADYVLTHDEFEFVASHDMLHTDLFGNVLSHLPAWHARGTKVVMDFSTFSEDPEFSCERHFPHVDYAFLSYDKGPDQHIRNWIQTIQSYGPKIVCATMGEHGSLAFDGKQYYECGIVPTQVVNTVGAGDSFIAGFTFGMLRGEPIPECMQRGAALSSKVITKFEPY